MRNNSISEKSLTASKFHVLIHYCVIHRTRISVRVINSDTFLFLNKGERYSSSF